MLPIERLELALLAQCMSRGSSHGGSIGRADEAIGESIAELPLLLAHAFLEAGALAFLGNALFLDFRIHDALPCRRCLRGASVARSRSAVPDG